MAATELAHRGEGVLLELNGSAFHTDVGLHPFRAVIESRCGIDRSTDADVRLRLLEAEIRSVGLDPPTRCRYWRRLWEFRPSGVTGRWPLKAPRCTT